ncbi:hypothetical protein [Demequina sp. NBRC 110054]|uniref:hypothetical protein n=1 Tax=Demequina sp. NBRC 110054 TaxID=1570343 RepID=UPI0011786136|nr:hypothetical protein [Demequina sp. NBRC 110054]
MFVDIDGTIRINEPDRDLLSAWPASSWRTTPVAPVIKGLTHRGKATWSIDVIEGLRTIGTLPGVRMCFLTTWLEATTTTFAPVVELGAWWAVGEDTPPDESSGFGSWQWKPARVLEAVQSGAYDRVVWMDDDAMDLRSELFFQDREKEIDQLDATLLTIAPDYRCGLTREDLDAAMDWLTP